MANPFTIDGVEIRTPTDYKPVFATTSTPDSDRTQDLVMHNTPMGTIAGYDMKWDSLTWTECATIINAMKNKPSFSFRHKDPCNPNGWSTASFYASNFTMAAQRLQDGQELWSGLTINIRSINPV